MKKLSQTLLLFVITLISFSGCQIKQEVDKDIDMSDAFVHSAYFWFKEGVSQERIEAFIKDAEQLKEIETVQGFFSGPPAPTTREVIENTYDFAVVFLFKDLEAQEFYQKAPLHLEMIEKHSDIWERVMVTDVE